MAHASKIEIPANLLPQFEALGRIASVLFGRLRQEGVIPQGVPESQLWYWSKEWQEWERQADEDIALGRTKTFTDVEALIADLDGRGD